MLILLFLLLVPVFCFYLFLVCHLLPLTFRQRTQLLGHIHLCFLLNLPTIAPLALSLFLQGLFTPPVAFCLDDFWVFSTDKAKAQSLQSIHLLKEPLLEFAPRWDLLTQSYREHCLQPTVSFSPQGSLLGSSYGLLAHAFCVDLLPENFPDHWQITLPGTHRGVPPDMKHGGFETSHGAGLFYQGGRALYSLIDLQQCGVFRYGPSEFSTVAQQYTAQNLTLLHFYQGQRKLTHILETLNQLELSIENLSLAPGPAACRQLALYEAQAWASVSSFSDSFMYSVVTVEYNLGLQSTSYGYLAVASFFGSG